MPDTRRHRGPHPDDARLFAPSAVAQLRQAADDLTWLLDRGYALKSSLQLVGNRYDLQQRQRIAVTRCVATSAAIADRRSKQLDPQELNGRTIWIDGYNVLTSIEAALGGGVILAARDGCYRDMASMHGSYRKVAETIPAVRLIGETLAESGVTECRWLLDSPVSNSGRLKRILEDLSTESGWVWTVDLVPNPDPVLIGCEAVVATSDSVILDGCRSWINLARFVIETRIPQAVIFDLSRLGIQ